MIEIGRVCIKIAGRDAGKKCVIIENIDQTFVLIDGQTRRRKCNIQHLEPLNQTLKIKKGASNAEVKKAFKTINIETPEPPKSKKSNQRPKKQRKVKEKKEVKKKEVKPKEKKEVKPKEKKEVKPKEKKEVKSKKTAKKNKK
jgi:large subunit ribosomal protein L14e